MNYMNPASTLAAALAGASIWDMVVPARKSSGLGHVKSISGTERKIRRKRMRSQKLSRKVNRR